MPIAPARSRFLAIRLTLLATMVAPVLAFGQTSRPTTQPAARNRPRTAAVSPGDLMDYGSLLSYSVLRSTPTTQPSAAATTKPATTQASSRRHATLTDGGELLAIRGITINVGNNSSVCFDTDLMAMAGGWTGGFLDLSKTNLRPGQGPYAASPRGKLAFSTLTDIGWSNGGTFVDPRDGGLGPLPVEWAHYKGLYRNGTKVVLSYTVGKTDVLELDGSIAGGGHVAFTRTLEVGTSKEPLRMLVCEQEGATGRIWPVGAISDPRSFDIFGTDDAAFSSVAILRDAENETIVRAANAPSGTKLRIVNGTHIEVVLPALSKPATLKLVIAHLPLLDRPGFNDLFAAASTVENVSALCKGGPVQWGEPISTQGVRGSDAWAYTVDTVRLPENNPWKSLMRPSAFDFLPDGRAAVATMNGDVWIVSGLDDSLEKVSWKRFAAGLYEPLGLKVVDGKIYVLGRDQITILHDLNNDGEADYYENFCNAWAASPIYHAFVMDLQADSAGNFYFSTCGNQAPFDLRTRSYGFVLKVPKAGGTVEQFANGLRAANGMGVGPHDEIVAADNQGNWTPTCRIDLVKKGGFYGFYNDPRRIKKDQVADLHLPAMYDPPICWLRYPEPDNSSGGQVWAGPNWGPLSGQLLSTSFGKSALLSVPWEIVDGVPQGGAIKLPLKFESGIMRARVSPKDGQVWVCGLKGWQTNAAREGSFQRVRYTGKAAHVPVGLHVGHDSIAITFPERLDKTSAEDEQNFGIEQWNYRWTETYGSPEFKVSNPTAQGHDVVDIKSVKLSEDGKTVTLQIPNLKPVMQMLIQMHIKSADGASIDLDFANTINKVPE